MPANVETMFSVRETPWHGLGRIVMDAPASREALELAGLDWQVESRNIYSGTGAMIPGYRANVRSTDNAVLGVVSDRYRIVQNEEAFQFTLTNLLNYKRHITESDNGYVPYCFLQCCFFTSAACICLAIYHDKTFLDHFFGFYSGFHHSCSFQSLSKLDIFIS